MDLLVGLVGDGAALELAIGTGRVARLAGLELRDRWAGWERTPFTGDSPSHVSVWQNQR